MLKRGKKGIKAIKADEYHENKQLEDLEEITYEDYDESMDLDNIDEYEIIEDDDNSYDEPSYDDNTDNDNLDDYELTNKKSHKYKKTKLTKILNIIFYTLIILMIMVTVDIISVSRYNRGPYFAIKTATLKDGGTKVYYGLGYKVIKYNQLQGRRDTEIGTWSMPYNVEPTEISALDLAIEYKNNPVETYQKYNKKFLRVTGDFISYDKNKLTFGYTDPDGAYTLNIVCKMSKDSETKEFSKDQKVTIIGSVSNYKQSTEKSPNTLYINDCFAE